MTNDGTLYTDSNYVFNIPLSLQRCGSCSGYNKKVWKKRLKVAYPFIGKQLENLIERKENATMKKDRTKGKKRSIVEYEMLEECIRKKA